MAFARPTLQQITARVEADLQSRLGLGPLLDRSVVKTIARVIAGGHNGEYGHLDYLSRQILPDTADGDHLARIASIWKVERKPAVAAQGNVVFAGTNGSTIPAGTKLRRADLVEYSTDVDAVIASGSATVAATAASAGLAGNAPASTALTLTSPVAGVNGTASIASGGMVGGLEQEDDEDLRTRLLQTIQEPPHGGAAADYVKWALEVPGVTRAWCLPEHLGLGTVGVTFTTDDDPDGPIPDGAKVTEVAEYIAARRPVTAIVTVFAPSSLALNPEIELVPDTAQVRAQVEANLADLLKRETSPGGTLLVSRVREAISTAAGESDHVLVDPVANVVAGAGQIIVLGTITWS